MHKIVISKTVPHPADGLMLGNGDFSVSCFQKPGKIAFQIGKNDFWDRRILLEENPKPAHIDELREAIQAYRLKVDGVTGKSNSDILPPRLRELCQGMPSQKYSSPCPKPGPTFYIHYPADWSDFEIRQTLEIENALLQIEIRHYDGASIRLEAVIHPQKNRLSIHWSLNGWTQENRYGGYFWGLPELPPVYGTLFRKDELSEPEFSRREFREHGNSYFQTEKILPSPERAVLTEGVLSQKLPSGEQLFCAAAHLGGGTAASSDNILQLRPELSATEGVFTIGVSSRSPGEARELSEHVHWDAECAEASAASRKFWALSAVSFPDDPLAEECWYAAMHAKRCVLKRGILPPGLFFPCSLQDFAMWHGDYHLNYNYQSIFLGDYETNHIETGDAYFDGLRGLLKLGEKISRDYYGIDGGCFIQLCGFPMETADDYFGSLPLGRMAYMTGWVAAYFHRRWQWTRDLNFLEQEGYPALKKFAVFYAGFLQRGEDGMYHAFPSNQGESEFSYAGAYDQTQVLHHAYFALTAAADAAETLGVDPESAVRWREIASRMPSCEDLRQSGLAPEFAAFDGEASKPGETPDFLIPGTRFHDWYFGQMPYKLSIALRTGNWSCETQNDALSAVLRRWRMPNGLLRAMSIATHGFRPGWTESLGVAGSLTDMLMTSDNGLIRLFPGIPANQTASFRTLRANGAFLVSACKELSGVTEIRIQSEAGLRCRIQNPTKGGTFRLTSDGVAMSLRGREFRFETVAGNSYVLEPE